MAILIGTDKKDKLNGKKNENNTIKGLSGNDVIKGANLNDEIYAGIGDDTITGATGQNTINYKKGDGNDIIKLTKGENFTLNLENVNKISDVRFEIIKKDLRIYADKTNNKEFLTIKNFASKDITNNGNAKKNIADTSSVEILINGKRYDLREAILNGEYLYSINTSKNYTGSWLNEEINASNAPSGKNGKGVTLKAGAGDDLLIGSAGDDKLYGGVGRNEYRISNGGGNDVVYYDKNASNDVLNFTDAKMNELHIEKGKYNGIKIVNKNGDSFELANYLKNGKTSVAKIHTGKDGQAKSLAEFLDGKMLIQHGDFKKNSLKGTSANDEIYGYEGNDTIKTAAGDDILVGGAGDDKLYGGAGKNEYQISTGDGNDVVYYDKTTNNDVLNFTDAKMNELHIEKGKYNGIKIVNKNGDSFELANYLKNGKTSVAKIHTGKDGQTKSLAEFLDGKKLVQYGDFKKNSLKGTSANDKIYGDAGNDTIKAGAGDDIIIGGIGDDKLYGEAGENKFYFSEGDGSDIIYSGKGHDTLIFDDVDRSLLSFEQGEKKNNKDLIIKYSETDKVTVKDYYAVDKKGNITGINSKNSIKHFEVNGKNIVFGTSNAENFVGTNEADYIYGEGGNDIISAGRGNDYLYGGEGNDVLNGEQGNDYLYGGNGNDTVNGSGGDDSLDGGYGFDTFVFRAGDGHDIIEPSRNGLDNDVIKFTTEQDLTYHKSPNNNDLIIKYNNGQDSITLKKYFESSSSYPKTILNGIKTLNLGEELYSNHLIVEGAEDSETIYGLNANAPKGNDIIYGYGGDDIIYGGSGEDIIIGGTGDDTMSVYNNDTFVFNIGDGNDVIDLGLVQTKEVKKATIKFNDVALSDLIFEKSENDIIIKYSETDSVILKNYLLHTCYNLNTPNSPEGSCHYNLIDCYGNNELISDMIKVNISGEGNIYGTIYDDIITGSNSGDNINAGAGNDVIYAGSGKNSVFAGAGDDIIHCGDSDNGTMISGGEGNDLIYVGSSESYIYGDAGDDIIFGANNMSDNTIIISGGDGNDIIYGQEASSVSGGRGNDTIYCNNAGFYNGDQGNNTYIVESTLQEQIHIGSNMVEGIDSSTTSDIVEIRNKTKNDLSIFVHITQNGVYGNDTNYESGISPGLHITNKEDFGNDFIGIKIDNWFSQLHYNQLFDGYWLEDYSLSNSVRKIITADSYYIDVTCIGNIKKAVVDWLKINNFTSTSIAMEECSQQQKNELKAIFDSAWKVYYDDIVGSDSDDNIQGTDIADKILANNGNDIIDAKKGNDIIDGGTGNNKYVFTEGDGQDTIINGNGNDTIQFNTKSGLKFSQDLSKKDLILTYGDNDIILLKDYYINNSHSVKTIINGNETLTLNDALNKYGIDIVGTASIDNIVGTDGNDTIYAGQGNDIIDGGKGNDTYIFERVYDGNDEIAQGSGEDTIKFLEKTSLTFTRYLNDLKIRNAGNDFITLKDYYLDNGHCVKFIQNGEEYTTVDEAINKYGITVVGTSGNDIIKGSNTADSIDAKRGNDNIYGLSGNDTFIFTSGDGKDTIINASGDDTVKFNEPYSLKFVKDLASNDLVIKYGNNDFITLQDYYLDESHSVKIIQNGEEVLTLEEAINNYGLEIKGNLNGQTIEGTSTNDTIIVTGGNGIIAKGEGQDSLKFENTQGYFFSRDLANDDLIINGITLKDYYIDNSHSVKIIQNGEEILTVQEAIDKYGINIIGTNETEEIMGSNGNDNIYAGSGVDIIYGYDGNDYIDGYSGGGTIYGGNGNDEILAPSLDATVYGEAGDDVIFGGAGNTTIYGGTGNDTLSCLIANTFVFNNEDDHDTITSYSVDSVIKFADSTLEDLIWMRKCEDLVIGYNLQDGVAQDTITIKNYSTQYKDSSTNKKLYVVGSDAIKKTIPEAIDYLTIDCATEKNTTSQYNVCILGTNNGETLLGNEGNDIIIANGGNDNLIGNSGNDTYYVKATQNAIITDNMGIEELYLEDVNNEDGNHNKINVTFNISKNYKVIDGTDFGNIKLLNGDNFSKWLSDEEYISITIENNSIETINTSDGYSITSNQIAQLAETVATWLSSKGYNDVQAVIDSGNTEDINTLTTYFTQDNNWNG